MASPGPCRCRLLGVQGKGQHLLCGDPGHLKLNMSPFKHPWLTASRRGWGTSVVSPLKGSALLPQARSPGLGLPLIGDLFFFPGLYLLLSSLLPSCHQCLMGPVLPAFPVGTKFSHLWMEWCSSLSLLYLCCPPWASWDQPPALSHCRVLLALLPYHSDPPPRHVRGIPEMRSQSLPPNLLPPPHRGRTLSVSIWPLPPL